MSSSSMAGFNLGNYGVTQSGYYGYRSLGRFTERHRRALITELKIPNATVPSYSTLRRVMMGLDYTQLRLVFNQWALLELNLSLSEGLSVDGKSLKNTVSDYDKAQQNFMSLVSVFSQKRGLVVAVQEMENKKVSEITVVRNLLESLDLKGYVFTIEALHCQKKLWLPSPYAAMTM
ncbi:MAG: ISAs1 family transposase [Moorea sp. SIO4E2]|uniref:ISAs1 family transposase n=1 Tax=Moorena sp. SIO4E2 TaxID=2607826 RepID=UPI0013B88101|nr:ISAs1 family transposase [Moorena sp. SIO4E2]NEQ12176.1 ISAs1 family transposase [Moorena sp. SIO4E2]